MKRNFLKCAILGGIIVFVWGIVSWMVLPWHMTTTHRFNNEEAVADAIRKNAPEDGVYFLPSCHQKPSGRNGSPEEYGNRSGMAKAKEKMKKGPLVFASVHLRGMNPESARPYIGSLIIQVIGAFFATWLFLRIKGGMSYGQQVMWFAVLGLFAGIVTALPAWNWMCFPVGWTIVTILDLVIGWTLAGLAIAKVAKK